MNNVKSYNQMNEKNMVAMSDKSKCDYLAQLPPNISYI